jgi:chromate reductase
VSTTLPTLLAISGSLRAASSNTAVIAAARALAPPGLDVVAYGGLGDLPFFNPDLDTETPPAPVLELRRLVGEADALLISSPEYAHGIPGVMKNALDWLVSSLEFPGKPVGLINASAGSVHAQAALEEVLRTMSAELVADACATLPWTGAKPSLERLVENPELSGIMRGVLAALDARARGGGGA